jgi:hypothetical protein
MQSEWEKECKRSETTFVTCNEIVPRKFKEVSFFQGLDSQIENKLILFKIYHIKTATCVFCTRITHSHLTSNILL